MTEARTYMDGYSDGKEWAQQTTAAGASPVEPSQEWKPALQAEVERLTTLARGQHIELYNARLQLAAAQGQEPVGYVAAGFLALGEGKIKEYADSTYKVAVYAAPITQPPAPSEAAREYMTGYSDGREWAKPSQALAVEPVYQYQLANGNWIDQTKESYDYNVKHGQATVRMLYATPQAAAQPERAPLSDAEIEDLRGEANRGYCIDKGDYFKAFRDAEQAHGIKQGGQQ